MTNSTHSPAGRPSWLVDWLSDASRQSQCHSIALSATCAADLHGIATAVADYLNEFDSQGGCQWRAFGAEDLRQFAGDPICRDLLLAGNREADPQPPPRTDLERITRRLARIGGVVLEGQCGSDATLDIPEVFHVCLCSTEHASHEAYHLWVNPSLFEPRSLISVLSDSFLDWSSHPQRPSGSQSPPATSIPGPGNPSRHPGFGL